MNEFLADLYGTNDIIGNDEQDFEKDAAANFLIKIAEEQDIDLNECSDDEIADLYATVEGEMRNEGEIDDEAQTKMAEADFLGRAMAHAYVAELDDIEKQASGKLDAAKALAGKVGRYIKSTPERIGRSIGGSRLEEYGLKKGKQHAASRAAAIRQAAGTSDPTAIRALELAGGKRARRISQVRAAIKKESRGVTGSTIGKRGRQIGGAVLGGGAALTAGTGYGLSKALGSKEKNSFNEQFEDAAAERANAWLESQGYDVEKVAEAQIEEALDERAIEMLVEAGYIE
jgi:hypothetical protein